MTRSKSLADETNVPANITMQQDYTESWKQRIEWNILLQPYKHASYMALICILNALP